MVRLFEHQYNWHIAIEASITSFGEDELTLQKESDRGLSLLACTGIAYGSNNYIVILLDVFKIEIAKRIALAFLIRW